MIRTSRRVFVTGIAGLAIVGTSLHLDPPMRRSRKL